MSKRFTDTEIWDKQWFMELSPKHKLLVKYVRDKCDIAGIWSPNYLLASVYIGEQVGEDDLLSIDSYRQFEKIEDKIYCIGFIDFQYGSSLNPESPIHKRIIDILSKYGIDFQLKQQSKSKFDTPNIEDVYKEMLNKTDEYNAQTQSKRFHSYYESNGWMVGRNKMKNWRSAAAGWINRSKPESKVRSESIKEKLNEIQNRKFTEI
jgi:hypothetical protein